jgi:hypothetical protein
MEEREMIKDRSLGRAWNAAKFQNIILLLISGLFLLALTVKLVLNVSRIDFVTTPHSMFPDGRSTATVQAKPYNVLGFQIPFKTVQVYYLVKMGGEKVDIVSRSKSSITLRAKREIGEVILEARPSGAAIPYEIIIPIVPQFAFKTD